TFSNREGRLPQQPKGYYREYTVPTPGESDRGARRIVTGGNPPVVYYFTADHYQSFKTLEVPTK
ncbi:MAG: ribonuclease domain-containing protein, partial [Psychrobacter sp.]|nr:ribonuclease domain-containing protein [Psychrobacter sp.]